VARVMTSPLAAAAGREPFAALGAALGGVGRMPYALPAVERAVYGLDGTAANPHVKVGADVLPWFPPRGVYLLVERGARSAADLVDVPGVAGAWWGSALPFDARYATADAGGLHISYCFLDDDPVLVAERLRVRLDPRPAP